MSKNSGKNKRGMTYIELIVVLGIFAVLAGVSIYSFGSFHSNVDIKNLANNVALKVVQAQKDSSFGKLPSLAQQPLLIPGWKPSYGIYIDYATDPKSFIYFTDTDNNNLYSGSIAACAPDCVEKINITQGSIIFGITAAGTGPGCASLNNLTTVFNRLSSSAALSTTTPGCTAISSATITVKSSKGDIASVSITDSGRIQVN